MIIVRIAGLATCARAVPILLAGPDATRREVLAQVLQHEVRSTSQTNELFRGERVGVRLASGIFSHAGYVARPNQHCGVGAV